MVKIRSRGTRSKALFRSIKIGYFFEKDLEGFVCSAGDSWETFNEIVSLELAQNGQRTVTRKTLIRLWQLKVRLTTNYTNFDLLPSSL